MAWIELRKTTKGKRYYVYWYENGKRHCEKAGPFKDQAIAIRNEREGKVALGEAGVPSYDKTVQEVADEFRKESARTKKDRTMEHIEYGLKKFTPQYGYRKIASITPQDIKQFLNSLFEKDHTANGVNMILAPITTCFNFAMKLGYVRANPTKSMKSRPQKVAKFLKADEMKKLLDACRYNKELKGLVMIALYTGMRKGEILRIRPDVVGPDGIRIEDTKTGIPRTVPIHPKIADLLIDAKWISKWKEDRLTRAFRRAVARAKLGRVRFHDLRHTFCSGYLQSGGTIADLREISGHKSLSALQIYAHFQPSYLKERIQGLNYDL